jgi:hypothetical protein
MTPMAFHGAPQRHPLDLSMTDAAAAPFTIVPDATVLPSAPDALLLAA